MHENSNKQAEVQLLVMKDVMHQIMDGNKSIAGLMVESNLEFGRQDIPEDTSKLTF